MTQIPSGPTGVQPFTAVWDNSYTYDSYGYETSATYPNGGKYNTTRDFLNRPFRLARDGAPGNVIESVGYNAADQITKMTWAGNPSSTYDPDAEGYAPFSQTWTYNERNQVMQIQTQVSQGQSGQWPPSVIDLNYGYSLANAQNNPIAGTNNGQVTSVLSGLDPTGVNAAYQYDQLGRLTAKTGVSGAPSQTFSYDGWGNLMAKSGGQSFSLNVERESNRLSDGLRGAGSATIRTAI